MHLYQKWTIQMHTARIIQNITGRVLPEEIKAVYVPEIFRNRLELTEDVAKKIT